MRINQVFRNPLHVKISAVFLSVLGILMLVFGLRKEIVLVVNGETQPVTTYAITVGGVLRSQDYALSEFDHLYPAPSTWLWGEETIYLRISSTIEIQADGDTVTLQTAEIHPQNVLLEAGISVFPKDRILVNGELISEESTLAAGKQHQILVLRGTPLTILTQSGATFFISDKDNLAEAFASEGLIINDADKLSRQLDTPLDGSPITVEWIQAQPVRVLHGDQSLTILTTEETVGAALAGAGLALQGMDYSVPAEYEPIPENRQVQIVRVVEEVLLNQEQIPFTSTYQSDINTELDQLSILSGGEFGISAQQFRVIYENGQEVSRDLEKEWVLQEPSPRVIGYGTKINLRTTTTADGPITYWRKITAYATSYNENCQGCNDYTYSGAYLQKGVIAVTRDWYYYMGGQSVYIPGYGFATIEDIGAGVSWSTNWVDLGYRSENYEHWSHYVDVYFLAPAPPPENIMYVLY
jgi:uncharacterized protein YabE (DUF348 family)